jgi:lipoate-protein ligase A
MNWWNVNSGPSEAAFNMALDEALLETVGTLGAPVLRFYGWKQPAATFGYFQHYAEIERTTLLRPLIRRPTGGGLVPHDADWTYSLAFPPGHEWHELRAEESYRRVHEWIQRAFAKLGVPTEVAPCCKKTAPGQCFVGYEKFDLLWHGRKIAGAAQRRNKLGLLIQGSVQPPPISLNREAWENAMRETELSGASWNKLGVGGTLLALTERLVTEKYSQAAYNQKR